MSLLSLKHIHTYSPDKITLQNSTPIVPTGYDPEYQWHLPSRADLSAIDAVLGDGEGYDFEEGVYWSSSEAYIQDSNTDVWCRTLLSPRNSVIKAKSESHFVIATRTYDSELNMTIGDLDANLNLVFNKTNNINGGFKYQVCRDLKTASTWSNITTIYAGTEDAFIADINQGVRNTVKILEQTGHISSAALIANQYTDVLTSSNTVHNFIESITADLFVFNTTTKINTTPINILNKLYINATRTTYVKSSLSTDHVLINEVVDNQFAVMTSNHNGPTATIDTEFYTPEFYITKADLGLSTNIPSGVYTLSGTIVYQNAVEENFTLDIVYYASIAVCIRQKLNEFVLDCNQCRSTDDVVPFFIAESAFQSLQYYEEDVLDVTAINKILASLNIFCNQKTCTTC